MSVKGRSYSKVWPQARQDTFPVLRLWELKGSASRRERLAAEFMAAHAPSGAAGFGCVVMLENDSAAQSMPAMAKHFEAAGYLQFIIPNRFKHVSDAGIIRHLLSPKRNPLSRDVQINDFLTASRPLSEAETAAFLEHEGTVSITSAEYASSVDEDENQILAAINDPSPDIS